MYDKVKISKDSTSGITESRLSINSWNILAAASEVLLLLTGPWEDSAVTRDETALIKLDCTSHRGCGGSGSTVRCPSKR